MPRIISLVCLTVALSSIAVSARFAADPPVPDFKESIVLLASANAQIADGRLIDETIRELSQRSATFEHMLRTLAASRVVTYISPSVGTTLPSGLMGRTRFVVGASKIAAFVEVVSPRGQERVRRGAIAHELAHVVEVACLGTIESDEVLLQRLRPQLMWKSDPRYAMETRFAVRAGNAVIREAQGKDRGVSQLLQLAEREGLTACPSLAPALSLASIDPVG